MLRAGQSLHATVGRPLLVAGAIALALALAGAGCGLGRRGVPPAPSGGGATITNAQRTSAMLSIHAHARGPGEDLAGAGFIALDEATTILQADDGPGAASRVRRAVAKLWAYGYGRPEFRRAGTELLAKYHVDFDRIDESLQEQVSHLLPPIPLPPPPELVTVVEAMVLNALASVTPACRYMAKVTGGGVAPTSKPVEWWYDVLVPRPVHDIARSLDPQSWAQTSTFFYQSYLVDAPSCCDRSTTTACAFATKTSTTDPQPGARRAAGQPYGATAFFESFCGGKNCDQCKGPTSCQVAFKNVLCVWTKYDVWAPFQCCARFADKYEAHYGFAQFLFGEILGAEGDAITNDFGELTVQRATTSQRLGLASGDWSVVHVEKTLEFQSPSIALGAATVLQSKAVSDELQAQIVEQACYDVPAECWFLGLPAAGP